MDDPRPTVLVVDDALPNLDTLVGLLKHDYRVKAATCGERALEIAGKGDPPAIVLLDIMMPGMGGFEVCRRFKEDDTLRGVPVIFISALDHVDDKVAAFERGGVDYITKPFQAQEVKARVQTHLELAVLRRQLQDLNRSLEERVREQVAEIAAGQYAAIFALTKLAESRDDNTGSHLERVREYCRLLGRHLLAQASPEYCLDASLVETIAQASSLHDIGKVAIRDDILLKPGRLTQQEMETMKLHTILGAHTLELVSEQCPRNTFVRIGMQIARYHHERWDGMGYMEGLEGADIPLPARIVALADTYDALRSARPYKGPLAHEAACRIIVEAKGTQFDPVVVDAFLACEAAFGAVVDAG